MNTMHVSLPYPRFRPHSFGPDPEKPPVYTANVTTNGTDPQSFPYADSYNQTCHMSLYCHGSPDCGPVGASPEFSLLHNHAAAAQTWGLSATASIGKAAAAAPTATVTSSSTSSLAAAKTAQKSASASVTEAVTTRTATAALQAGSGLSVGAKAGIGVGVAVGAIAVLAALCFCVVRARGRPRRGEMSADALGAPEMMSEQEYTTRPGGVGPSRHEMSGEGRLNELQGTPQAELSSVASPVR